MDRRLLPRMASLVAGAILLGVLGAAWGEDAPDAKEAEARFTRILGADGKERASGTMTYG